MRDVSQTQCKEAERSERQSTSKSDAKCKDKTHDEQSRTAADEMVPEVLEARETERERERERESCKAPPDV